MMKLKPVIAVGAMVTTMATAAVLTSTGAIGHHEAVCPASQPVYVGTQQVGTWNVVLHAGQSVNLPDGDTATCTSKGLIVQ
jgi:hypothetical protein